MHQYIPADTQLSQAIPTPSLTDTQSSYLTTQPTARPFQNLQNYRGPTSTALYTRALIWFPGKLHWHDLLQTVLYCASPFMIIATTGSCLRRANI